VSIRKTHQWSTIPTAWGLPKVGAERVGDHLHGDRAVLGWGDQTWTSLTKTAPTTGPWMPSDEECDRLESMRDGLVGGSPVPKTSAGSSTDAATEMLTSFPPL
jgi:hypothetical protein